MFRHPKYYKELRKRNRAGSIDGAMLPDSQSDQAISEEATDGFDTSVRPGPGLKQRDSQVVNQVELSSQSQASSVKPQAASDKPQALKLSNQPQASSAKRQASQPE